MASPPRWTTRRRRVRAVFKISLSSPANVDQLDGFKAPADSVRRQSGVTRLRPLGRGGSARPAPHAAPAAGPVPLAGGPRGAGADRRLVLPPRRPRRAGALAGAEHVRCRPGGVPDRPGRRRLRLPVRHPREVPRRQRLRRRVRQVWRNSELFTELAGPSRPAPAAAAGTTTAAAAAAWPRSSSRGLPIGAGPECVQGYGSRRWPPTATSPVPRRPLPDGAAQAGPPTRPAPLQRKSGLEMARDTWFETVAVAQQRARKRPPKAVYQALLAGSEKG